MKNKLETASNITVNIVFVSLIIAVVYFYAQNT